MEKNRKKIEKMKKKENEKISKKKIIITTQFPNQILPHMKIICCLYIFWLYCVSAYIWRRQQRTSILMMNNKWYIGVYNGGPSHNSQYIIYQTSINTLLCNHNGVVTKVAYNLGPSPTNTYKLNTTKWKIIYTYKNIALHVH